MEILRFYRNSQIVSSGDSTWRRLASGTVSMDRIVPCFLDHKEPRGSVATYSTFPLIQPSFVKLTQLAQFDKISHAW